MKMIPVFYSEKMVADSGSVSPSAAKPGKVVESWLRRGFPVEVAEPEPVTRQQICLAHDPDHVADVLECRDYNGFDNKSPSVAATLPYTTGSMLSAAKRALQTKAAAAAPCSGFHHAGFYTCEGFCTFNGLMVTALSLFESGLVSKRVGILDFDMHYGNGTDQIIGAVRAQDKVRHYTAGAHYHMREQAADFFRKLDGIVSAFSDCDVVLYQAGADPHVADPFGGWLTTEELRLRDARVFELLKGMGVPVAWNLAGGYQVERDGSIPKVIEIHDNTMAECVRVYCTG